MTLDFEVLAESPVSVSKHLPILFVGFQIFGYTHTDSPINCFESIDLSISAVGLELGPGSQAVCSAVIQSLIDIAALKFLSL